MTTNTQNVSFTVNTLFGVCELTLTQEQGMERLTKKELRALLECIKECYPICDLETFAQRVVSRLSKIVPAEYHLV